MVVTKTTVKSRTLQAIKGATEEATLKTINLSFVTGKTGKHDYHEFYNIFERVYGTVQNFLWDISRGLWDYVKLAMGCSQNWPKAGKGRIRVDLGGHVGRCGGGGLTCEQAAVHFTVCTYIIYVLCVCVCVCACIHSSRIHASPRRLPGPKSVHGWASAARNSNPPQSQRPLDSAVSIRSLGLF